ncbi:hypothetical protein L0B53_09525 [Vibrio sp. SS-MA-C1-2]|uniref:hypothetical protein n=1 Tax=Vibrio sp. SS-MA-C1-2 TaxID=2908646 RepID=UPI001F46EB01|nr:hypothetical protein [Vibrio sp. SS-MA-C1-2]UJF19712.1 hypothetical protein L0B53_09525 [Vibrio sp. SS-MA-C1-2]
MIATIGYQGYQYYNPKLDHIVDVNDIEFITLPSDKELSYGAIAGGVTQKLIADIVSITDLEISPSGLNFDSNNIPGKSVYIHISEKNHKQYLHIKYVNNASQRISYSHHYLLTESNIKETIINASQDLLIAMDIQLTDKQKALMSYGIIDDQKALIDLLRISEFSLFSNHGDNSLIPFKERIEVLDKLTAKYPNNNYILAQNYLYHNIYALTSEGSDDKTKAQTIKLGEMLVTRYPGHVDGIIKPTIIEAIALQALVTGDNKRANFYINGSLKSRNSFLSLVLSGKMAELRANFELAGNFYSEAFYIRPSKITYQFIQNIVFYTELDVVAPTITKNLETYGSIYNRTSLCSLANIVSNQKCGSK